MAANWDAPIRLDKKSAGAFPLLDPGSYEGRLFEVEGKDSKAGNPMLKVTIKLDDGKGRVFDNVTITDQSLFRVRQFLLATGIDEEVLESAELTPSAVLAFAKENVGNEVTVELGVELGTTDQQTGRVYDDKNRITKYVHPDAALVGAGTGGWE
jgi:hypothetical protein